MQTQKPTTLSLLTIIAGLSLLASFMPVSDSYAFRVGDADPLIHDMWLEPANPKPGDTIGINSTIYNIGTQSTKSVTDVVTIGYLINGDLVKIDELPDVLPGIENGMQITTGPLWPLPDGIHVVTAILNYHDTLSHLTDNLENNIMQKVYHVGNWEEATESLISFDLSQKYIPETQRQQIIVNGNITLPENLHPSEKPRVLLKIGDQTHSILVDKENETFYFREAIPVYRDILPVSASFDNERYQNIIGYDYEYNSHMYPRELSDGDSAIYLKMQNISSDLHSFENSEFTVVIYDDSYQMVKSINTNKIAEISSASGHDTFFTSVPGNTEYFVEVYLEGHLFHTSQMYLEENSVVRDEIKVSEFDEQKIIHIGDNMQ